MELATALPTNQAIFKDARKGQGCSGSQNQVLGIAASKSGSERADGV